MKWRKRGEMRLARLARFARVALVATVAYKGGVCEDEDMAEKAKDAPFKFVHNVEDGLFKLYQVMDGPSAVYVNEGEFGREIRACVSCFYWEKERHKWIVNQALANDDDKALEVLEKQVCVHLAAAAEMGEDMRRYSPAIQAEFARIWRYVREWLGEDAGTGGRDVRALLAALREFLDGWEREA